MKEISFLLKLEDDAPKIKYSIFENLVIVHKDNQGTIALAVAQKMWPCTKHIAIKYHHFLIFLAGGILKIQHVDMREKIADIVTKPSDSELLAYLRYKLNVW